MKHRDLTTKFLAALRLAASLAVEIDNLAPCDCPDSQLDTGVIGRVARGSRLTLGMYCGLASSETRSETGLAVRALADAWRTAPVPGKAPAAKRRRTLAS